MAITNNGVRQWKFQRLSNLIIVIAGAVLISTLFCNSISSHAELRETVSQTWFQLFFGIALLFACLNSVLAGWQIAADYAQKINVPVSALTGLVALVSLGYAIYGLMLLF